MRVLVIGNGAREHAIAWKLRQSPRLSELMVAPGNAGTAQVAENVAVAAEDVDGLLGLAQSRRTDLTVVGPEAPLAAGIVDRFCQEGLLVFGPTRAAARIETSKSFAKAMMTEQGVPTGRAQVFDDYGEACEYVRASDLPVVIKADGLAAGKGVVVATTHEMALEALRRHMVVKQFGAAGERVLVEEFMEGQEISVFGFVDGERVSPLVAACDYKRVGDGDTGPNTGGMGAYSPPIAAHWNEAMEARIRGEIMSPVVSALKDRGTPYKGALYAGLMLTTCGPKVLEFNCRLGDPETQVVFPRLKSDLLDIMASAARGDLSGVSPQWDRRACVGVVVASGGYPGGYQTGFPIDGLDDIDDGVTVFHAGARRLEDDGGGGGAIVSDGGRVLTITALGETLEEARSRAYSGAERIRFEGSFYRRDIAAITARP